MSTFSPRVLVADDQEDVRVALELLLKGEGFEVAAVESPAAALHALERQRFDAALVDLNYARDTTSGAEGLDLLGRVLKAHPSLPVLLMTAWGSLELAVTAMKRGARDFVMKPWDNATLVSALRAQLGSAPGPAHDLELARRVQSELLPRAAPASRVLDVAARCVQAGAVGGDAYDFLRLSPTALALALGDASGKGISAALLMANLLGCLRAALRPPRELAATLAEVNRQFLRSTAPEHFASLFLSIHDEDSRRLRYVNCGHNPPLVLRANGALDRLPPTAPVLGLLDDWSGGVGEVAFRPGDTLLVYSDGMSEASGANEEAFGEARLAEALRECGTRSARECCETLLGAVACFASGDGADDRTLIVARAL
jgi:sigma-B regulation protein RsbU (phosphoserine phosphatase)